MLSLSVPQLQLFIALLGKAMSKQNQSVVLSILCFPVSYFEELDEERADKAKGGNLPQAYLVLSI
jgi:hypothetical protein